MRRRLLLTNRKININNYFITEAIEDCYFTFSIPTSINTDNFKKISYSIDTGKTWNTLTNFDNKDNALSITTPIIKETNIVLWKGVGNKMFVSNSACTLRSSGKYSIKGRLMSLLNIKNDLFNSDQFRGIFYGDTNIVSAIDLTVPNGTYPSNYMYEMFRNSSIEYGPIIKINYGNTSCFRGLFAYCSKLKYAHVVFKTNASSNVYYMLFQSVPNSCITVMKSGVHGSSGIGNTNTIRINYDFNTDKYYLADGTTECDKYGNVINI